MTVIDQRCLYTITPFEIYLGWIRSYYHIQSNKYTCSKTESSICTLSLKKKIGWVVSPVGCLARGLFWLNTKRLTAETTRYHIRNDHMGFWLSLALWDRDPIIKPDSFSSRGDNGRGLIQRVTHQTEEQEHHMNHSTLDILPIVMLWKILFSPGLSLCGIVFPLQWSHLRPLRSLRLRFRLLVQRYVF